MRGRYAPSPSGRMHLGNAQAALLAWLAARAAGSSFVLRMEDLDPARSRPEHAQAILSDLAWLGLDWDEGPDRGGPFAPYVQSLRQVSYHAALRRLAEQDLLYPCYCSRRELQAAQAPHGLASEGPRCSGRCARLSQVHRRRLEAVGKRPSWRFRVPPGRVTVVDAVHGTVTQEVDRQVGDFVVCRSDGVPAYQLAVVCDDAAMQIQQVVRGADLLGSTPRQVLLYRALGWQPPQFAHVPLLVDGEGRRLAKRDGSLSLAALRSAGVPSQRIIGWLAYQNGLLPAPEEVSPGALIPFLIWACLPRTPVVVDDAQLALLLGAG